MSDSLTNSDRPLEPKNANNYEAFLSVLGLYPFTGVQSLDHLTDAAAIALIS